MLSRVWDSVCYFFRYPPHPTWPGHHWIVLIVDIDSDAYCVYVDYCASSWFYCDYPCQGNCSRQRRTRRRVPWFIKLQHRRSNRCLQKSMVLRRSNQPNRNLYRILPVLPKGTPLNPVFEAINLTSRNNSPSHKSYLYLASIYDLTSIDATNQIIIIIVIILGSLNAWRVIVWHICCASTWYGWAFVIETFFIIFIPASL